jgi:hypothetical protein
VKTLANLNLRLVLQVLQALIATAAFIAIALLSWNGIK